MSTTVYIVQAGRPWLQAEVFVATLKTTASGATWATVDRLNGRRFKVGSTAFLTPEAANMRRLGRCASNLQEDRAEMLERVGAGEVVNASARAQPPRVFTNQIATT